METVPLVVSIAVPNGICLTVESGTKLLVPGRRTLTCPETVEALALCASTGAGGAELTLARTPAEPLAVPVEPEPEPLPVGGGGAGAAVVNVLSEPLFVPPALV